MQRVYGVEPLEEHRPSGDHLLPKLQLFAQSLDKVKKDIIRVSKIWEKY